MGYTLTACLVTFVAILVGSSHAQNSPKIHNFERYQVGVDSLIWDERIEAYAKHNAKKRIHDCKLKYSKGKYYGENIAWSSYDDFSAVDAVQMWVNQKANYDYETNTCQKGKVCAQYSK